MDENKLAEELKAVLAAGQDSEVFFSSMLQDATMSLPPVIEKFRAALISILFKRGCEEKEVIKSVALSAIGAVITNQFVRVVLIEVLNTAIDAICANATEK